MNIHSVLPVSLLLCCLFSACKKEENFQRTDFYNCHHTQSWDASNTYSQLIGKWQLIYTYDAFNGEQPIENVILIFTDDNLIRVFRDGQQILITSFYIIQKDGDMYGIATNQFSDYVEGRLLYCGNEMECNNSYAGGRDHYFRKAL